MSDTGELSAYGRLSVTRVPDLHDPVLCDTGELSLDAHMYDTRLFVTMILTGENIVHYLIDRNILSAESVVDGDLIVMDMTRRNRNFKILRKGEAGYFVKQVKNYEPSALSSLTREAQSYWLAKYAAGFKGISSLMPRLIDYDTNGSILITELFPGFENLTEMYQRLGNFPLPIASSLGASLGAYHREVDLAREDVDARKVFPRGLPWILTITPQFIRQAKATDANHQQFFTILEQYPEFLGAIERLRAGWQVNSLIHGDMKWDNCIVYEDEVKIIDWELADLGDYAWDAGSIFQNFLTLWVGYEAAEAGTTRMDAMQSAMAAFWKAYAEKMSLDKDARAVLLEKCCQLAAIRMIQTGYEFMHFSKKLDRNGILLLQLSLNILKDPREATTVLLGL
jgi:hypothetical protein